MARLLSNSQRKLPWFSIALGILFLIALGLRLWGLGRFNDLVFDEVYYANFAASFLQGKQEFGGHPPLSTYFIAVGIWVGERLGLGDGNTLNTLTGMAMTTQSYRWLNAVIGSFYPVVVGAIALQLTHRRLYGLLAALLALLDGMFLVESRYALNNIYLVLLGLLGNLFWLMALNHLGNRSDETMMRGDRMGRSPLLWLWLVLAGMGFGGAIAIKWNGAGFLLGALALWALAGVGWVSHRLWGTPSAAAVPTLPLNQLTRFHPGHGLVTFVLVPMLTYWLSWLPYLALGPNGDFWDWQQQILSYHHRVGGMDAHPYCSPWYSWPFMVRPVAYFYQTVVAGQALPPAINVTPPPHLNQTIYDVHAMGNPILWWFSTLGILMLVGVLGKRLGQWLARLPVRSRPTNARASLEVNSHPWRWDLWTLAFLVVNWGANWLPWLKVTRCVFLYHYMGATVFALLAIALWLERGFRSPSAAHRQFAIAVLLAILLGFLFWLPLFLGLPLSPQGVQIRRWFLSWV